MPRLIRFKLRYVLVIFLAIFVAYSIIKAYNYLSYNKVDVAARYIEPAINEAFKSTYEIYLYPNVKRSFSQISDIYARFLDIILESKHHTESSNQATIFALTIDTLNRDPLQQNTFVENIQNKFNALSSDLWNNGSKHVIFVQFSGTWPDYNPTDLGFNFGNAVLVKCGFQRSEYRPHVDISFPLFDHTLPKTHFDLPINRYRNGTKRYLAVFKGKRYLTGMGSYSRNFLRHLHNGNDVVMLTTCRHGPDWTKYKDNNCDADEAEYEKYDYQTLINHSSFCFVPRGRRLSSFRFVEVLRSGCIPVILADGWILPFYDVIDWKRAAILVNESCFFDISDKLRSLPNSVIESMRKQVYFLYDAYFSTVQDSVMSAFEIVHSRSSNFTGYFEWNDLIGGVWSYVPGYTAIGGQGTLQYPFYKSYSHQDSPKLTVIFHINKPSHRYLFRIRRFLQSMQKSKNVAEVYILLPLSRDNKILPKKYFTKKVVVLTQQNKTQGIFYGFQINIKTEAVLLLGTASLLKPIDINSAIKLYKLKPASAISISFESQQFYKTRILIPQNDALIIDRYYFDWIHYRTRGIMALNFDYTLCFNLFIHAVVHNFFVAAVSSTTSSLNGNHFVSFLIRRNKTIIDQPLSANLDDQVDNQLSCYRFLATKLPELRLKNIAVTK